MEITEIPPLSKGEESLVDFHSVLNTLNVLRGELEIIGLFSCNDPGLCADSIAICTEMVAALSDREQALRTAARVDAHAEAIFRELRTRLPAELPPESTREIEQSVANIRSVFAILRVRAREMLARAAAASSWESVDPLNIRIGLTEFFKALEKNSKGRFRIVFNAARQEATDYYVDLKIETAASPRLAIPSVFRDVMRDLIANARKYTPPGGKIIAAMYADARHIQFVVSDTGRGIPEGELATVVEFGKRASNVADVRANGGGFGLTKAFLVTKQFQGRFWIDSVVGQGTRVRIQIPTPDEQGR